MARRFFPGNPIGRRFNVNKGSQFEVIGVVADAKYRRLREEPMPTYYLAASQLPDGPGTFRPIDIRFEVRLIGDQAAFTGMLPQALRDVDPDVMVADVTTMDDVVNESVSQDRLLANLTGWFGGLALLLASVGVYGVRSYGVSRQTTEIGIRMALGADRRRVFWTTLRGSLWLAATGITAGVLLALAASRVVRSLLFELEPGDPVTVATAAAVMALVGVVASAIPAYRASTVHSMVALRHE
jgi:ABC-type antimicrobial peptide transport system permease subunit